MNKGKGFVSFYFIFYTTRYVCKAFVYRARASYESALTNPTIASPVPVEQAVSRAPTARQPPGAQWLRFLRIRRSVSCIQIRVCGVYFRWRRISRPRGSRARSERKNPIKCVPRSVALRVRFQSRAHYAHPFSRSAIIS